MIASTCHTLDNIGKCCLHAINLNIYTKTVCISVGSTNVKMLCGYITTLKKNKQKLDVSNEGPSSRVYPRADGAKRRARVLIPPGYLHPGKRKH
jgi:hypothetical protein